MVLGIDVARLDRSLHAVALEDGRVCATKSSLNQPAFLEWCLRSRADVIAINGPGFGAPAADRLRSADRQLLDEGISRLSTPTEGNLGFHGLDMQIAHELYAGLAPMYSLFRGQRQPGLVVIETRAFPVVATLAGDRKKEVGYGLTWEAVMRTVGFDLDKFGCTWHAAIAAFVAQCFVADAAKCYGDAATGYVVLPDLRKLKKPTCRKLIGPAKEPCERCYGEMWVCHLHPYRPFLDCPDCGGEGDEGVACVCNPGAGLPFKAGPFADN